MTTGTEQPSGFSGRTLTHLNPHPLSILSQSPVGAVKALAEEVLALLEAESANPVQVLQNRTGIVMLPYTDSVKGTKFHIGEVLMAEAHVRLNRPSPSVPVEGYGACMGRDLQQALAIAIIDAALRANLHADAIHAFVSAQTALLQQADDTLMHKVEATRVEMETF
jgi:alpha-D-ribose 1-methylphosphonate 5-triphosphate synthase subunit PhnG